ncbi:MAG: hypothetical protein JO354_01160 [Verrucomicrobia bacterium]|nr:hypothetical protein [Verrucomicrobiota bacterium]
MTFFSREETRSGRTINWLENLEAGLRIGVSRLGAELISIERRNSAGEWIGFLHRDNDLVAPESGWANHATIMGYYLHRLKDQRSFYRGHEIRGGTHSFARSKTWHLADQRDGAITLRITPEDFSPTEYPLNVSLELTYSLDSVMPSEAEESHSTSLKGTPRDPSTSLRSPPHDKEHVGDDAAVQVKFSFINHEPQLSAHVGFGIHPGFGAHSFESFVLNMPAGVYRRYFSPGNYLSGETQDIEFAGGPMPFKREELPGSFILELVHLESREFVFEDRESERAVTVNSGSAPYLTLWSNGGPFLCIEPCWGLTDAHEQRAFEDKLGIQIIPPEGKLTAECSISPRLLTR